MKKTHQELREMYELKDLYHWMEILSDDQKDHPAYKNYRKQKRRLKRIFDKIDFKPEHRVADFGCGNGVWGDFVAPKVGEFVGVDFSDSFIEMAKRRHNALGLSNSNFHAADIVNFAQENNESFDQAFALDFSEHIYDEDFLKIFAAIRDTLKPGAELYLHTPNGDYFLEILKDKGILKQNPGHIGIRNPKEHIDLLKQIGFERIEVIYPSHYLPLLASIHFMSYLPFLGKHFRPRLLIRCVK